MESNDNTNADVEDYVLNTQEEEEEENDEEEVGDIEELVRNERSADGDPLAVAAAEAAVHVNDNARVQLAHAAAPNANGDEKQRPMISPALKKHMQIKNYKVLGTHGALKLCRWAQNETRGRGACYKFTCYGLLSSQCMQMSPNLSCANKCIFCWRHNENPTATDWRLGFENNFWPVDDPERIVDEAIKVQRSTVKMLRGVEGVTPERFALAMEPKHAALSLIGEPIQYPRINEMCSALHTRGVSTFLVTKGQFPDELERLAPVTQLYVSVDAPNEEEAKAVQRPVRRDFWQCFLASLKSLRKKRDWQRTVLRFTLIKGTNMHKATEYAQLVRLALPWFIELKGFTFFGVSEHKHSDLQMQDVPLHEEMRAFAKQLQQDLANEYELACEHEHSCMVLLAHKSLKAENGKGWRTWIDFAKFFELMKQWRATHKTDFGVLDYVAPTPDWALFDSPAQGFCPAYKRHRRKKARPVADAETLAASDSKLSAPPACDAKTRGAQAAVVKLEGDPSSGLGTMKPAEVPQSANGTSRQDMVVEHSQPQHGPQRIVHGAAGTAAGGGDSEADSHGGDGSNPMIARKGRRSLTLVHVLGFLIGSLVAFIVGKLFLSLWRGNFK